MMLADIRTIVTTPSDDDPGKDLGDHDPKYQQALEYDH